MKPAERLILKDRGFRGLLVARTAVLFGTAMGPVGLAFAVLALPHGTGGELGLVLVARTAAQIALLLVGGVLADRFSKTAVMTVADAVNALAQGATAVIVLLDRNPQTLLVALSALSGAATGAFMPASTAVLPELVPRDGVQPANAVLRTAQNAAAITGGVLAGGLIAWVGGAGAVAANALAYGVSVCALLSVPRRPRPQGGAHATGMLRDLVEGWHAFRSRTWVWAFVAQFAVVNAVFTGAVRVLAPVMAADTPSGPALWALAQTGLTVGLLAGSVIALRWAPHRPLRVAATCVVGFAPPLLLLGAGAPLWAVAIALFLTGACSDLFTVFWETALQTEIPPAQLSRISSYDALGSLGLMPLGSAVAAPLAGSDMRAFALVAGGVVIVLLTAAVLLVPAVRHMPGPSHRPEHPDVPSDEHREKDPSPAGGTEHG